MNRRQLLVGLGGISAGASTLVGSGAFSAARIQRETSIAVVPDSDALVGLGPCPAEDRTSAYVVEENGQFALQISEENDTLLGDGVNVESIYWFDSVFEACNQSDHGICIDFHVDVPEIPGPVPNGYENQYGFEAGDDAVVFYEADNRDAVIDVSSSSPDNEGYHLAPGDCLCVGFVVRAFGFDAGTDIFADASLTISAFAGDDCGTETPGDGGDDDGGDDGDDETETDGLKGISFVAFCSSQSVPDGVSIEEVLSTNDNGEAVELEWSSRTAIDEVVIKAGTEWYRFDVDGVTGGTVIAAADDANAAKTVVGGGQTFTFDDDPSGDSVRCPDSPCLSQAGAKLEAGDGFTDIVTTNVSCSSPGQ